MDPAVGAAELVDVCAGREGLARAHEDDAAALPHGLLGKRGEELALERSGESVQQGAHDKGHGHVKRYDNKA
jgi:hypothetical protein